jgi:hypothetical protein
MKQLGRQLQKNEYKHLFSIHENEITTGYKNEEDLYLMCDTETLPGSYRYRFRKDQRYKLSLRGRDYAIENVAPKLPRSERAQMTARANPDLNIRSIHHRRKDFKRHNRHVTKLAPYPYGRNCYTKHRKVCFYFNIKHDSTKSVVILVKIKSE